MGSKFDFRMSRSDYDDLCFDLTDDEHAVLDLKTMSSGSKKKPIIVWEM